MTDAERLEKWYAEQNFIPGVKSISQKENESI